MAKTHEIRIKRIYEARSPGDGFCILVDRLWPRGIKKEDAGADLWAKEAAPSKELRSWYGHDAARFEEFSERYQAELDASGAAAELKAVCREHLEKENVTLLFAAKDAALSNAAVLRDWLAKDPV